ncbi:MAG: sodium/proline symporter [Pseudomonadales bacterium]
MEKTTIVLITLVVYKFALIGIGFWAQRRVSDTTDFFLAGRTVGPFVSALSYSASSSSAWTLLGLSGLAYVMGVSALWVASGSVVGMLVAWFWVGPRLLTYSHKHKMITLTDFLAHGSVGHWRRAIIVAASIVVLVSFAFYVAAQFQGAGNTFASTFDMNSRDAIILGGLIVMVYTFLGGFWAVSVTDAVQGTLMAAAALLLPITALVAVGGFEGFVEGLRAVSTPEQLSFSAGNVGLMAVGFIVGSLSIGLATFGQPHLLVRFMALRDNDALRQARILTTAWFAIVFGGMVFLGLAGRILYPAVANPETVFFVMTEGLFSPVVGGIILAAVLSAIMSTADSQLLVAAASVTHDMGVGRRLGNRHLLVSRLTIAVLTILSILVALYLPATIFNRALFAWVALGAAFGPLVLLRLGNIHSTSVGTFFAIVVGFVMAVSLYLLPNTVGDIAERMLPFCSGLLILWFTRQRVSP